MRCSVIFMTLLLYASATGTAKSASLCEQLTLGEIGTIAGTVMRLTEERTAGSRSTCSYVGEQRRITISVAETASAAAASEEFTRILATRGAGITPDKPLRGVGVEARYREISGSQAMIVARFGPSVLVLSGTIERRALVELARAVGAHLQKGAHGAPTHPSQ